jgi:hypothetical protein
LASTDTGDVKNTNRLLFRALETSIAFQNAQPIKSEKIYIKDDLMFINDVNKGFHVYDYTDPKNLSDHFIKLQALLT